MKNSRIGKLIFYSPGMSAAIDSGIIVSSGLMSKTNIHIPTGCCLIRSFDRQSVAEGWNGFWYVNPETFTFENDFYIVVGKE